MPDKNQIVRWGVMSTARIATKVRKAIQQTEGAKLSAVASRSADRAAAWAKEHGADRSYGDYQALLDDDELDAIYIPLPPSMHAEWTIRAAQHGKHVLCEKPMALSAEEAGRIAEAARGNGVLVQEAAMYRYHEQTRQVCEWVANGEIGDIRVIQGFFGFTLDRGGDIRFDPSLGGGSLWDIGSYPVSFARTVMGANPVEVEAQQVLSDSGVDLTFTGQMRFASGALAQIASSFQVTPYWNAAVIGSNQPKANIRLQVTAKSTQNTNIVMTSNRKRARGRPTSMTKCIAWSYQYMIRRPAPGWNGWQKRIGTRLSANWPPVFYPSRIWRTSGNAERKDPHRWTRRQFHP